MAALSGALGMGRASAMMIAECGIASLLTTSIFTFQPVGTVMVWLPAEPPLKLNPPCTLLYAANTLMFTVLVAALYDMKSLTFVSGARTTRSASSRASARISASRTSGADGRIRIAADGFEVGAEHPGELGGRGVVRRAIGPRIAGLQHTVGDTGDGIRHRQAKHRIRRDGRVVQRS